MKKGSAGSDLQKLLLRFEMLLTAQEIPRAVGEEKKEEREKKVLKNNIFEKLPKGRDFSSHLRLLPGINHETLLKGISIGGGDFEGMVPVAFLGYFIYNRL